MFSTIRWFKLLKKWIARHHFWTVPERQKKSIPSCLQFCTLKQFLLLNMCKVSNGKIFYLKPNFSSSENPRRSLLRSLKFLRHFIPSSQPLKVFYFLLLTFLGELNFLSFIDYAKVRLWGEKGKKNLQTLSAKNNRKANLDWKRKKEGSLKRKKFSRCQSS